MDLGHTIGHIIEHAIEDSIVVLPFLFLVYLLINYLEHNSENKLYKKLIGGTWKGPVLGSLLGCLPQCGFSVMGANLYGKRMITMGTVLAIFISTSDEAIPILFANPGMMHIVVFVLAVKVIFAMVAGIAIDYVMNRSGKVEIAATHVDRVSGSCHCHDTCCGSSDNIWKSTLIHTAKVFAFIVVINIVFGGIIEVIGEDTLSRVLLQDSICQPALAALIGLVPNCAASIILTQMYVAGSISIGALVAGLCTGAGIGLVVLFKINKNLSENLKVLGLLYILGTLVGMIIDMLV